jgi:hypothetical protein
LISILRRGHPNIERQPNDETLGKGFPYLISKVFPIDGNVNISIILCREIAIEPISALSHK